MGCFNLLNTIRGKKNKYFSCGHLQSSLFFDYENNVKLCPFLQDRIIVKNFNGLWLDISKIIEKRKNSVEEMKNGIIPDECKKCHNLKNIAWHKSEYIETLYLNQWRYCYINCCYCNSPKQENLIEAKHFDVMPAIEQLIDKKLFTVNTKVVFECGDSCIHPEFDKLMYFFINYGIKEVTVNTPALRYCQSIADALSNNITNVVISLDAGCAYIYERIKGLNKFDIAISNIKRYKQYEEPSQKRVVLKYTIIKGINDNEKEILDWYILSKNLGIKKLVFDIAENWFREIKDSIPDYLKEIILFVRKISDFNEIKIEFCERAAVLYNLIKNEQNQKNKEI